MLSSIGLILLFHMNYSLDQCRAYAIRILKQQAPWPCAPILIDLDQVITHPTDSLLLAALEQTRPSKVAAARLLGITKANLLARLAMINDGLRSAVPEPTSIRQLLEVLAGGGTLGSLAVQTSLHQGLLARVLGNIFQAYDMRMLPSAPIETPTPNHPALQVDPGYASTSSYVVTYGPTCATSTAVQGALSFTVP